MDIYRVSGFLNGPALSLMLCLCLLKIHSGLGIQISLSLLLRVSCSAFCLSLFVSHISVSLCLSSISLFLCLCLPLFLSLFLPPSLSPPLPLYWYLSSSPQILWWIPMYSDPEKQKKNSYPAYNLKLVLYMLGWTLYCLRKLNPTLLFLLCGSTWGFLFVLF